MQPIAARSLSEKGFIGDLGHLEGSESSV
jgi:hypothetical protein